MKPIRFCAPDLSFRNLLCIVRVTHDIFSGKNMPKWKYSQCPYVDLTWLISVFRFACSQTTVFKCLILNFLENQIGIALIHPLFIEEEKLFDNEGRRVATFYEVSSLQQLQLLQPVDKQPDNVIINLLDWQVYWLLTAHYLSNLNEIHQLRLALTFLPKRL